MIGPRIEWPDVHVYDIEDALQTGDTLGLQHAFRVLIEFPHRGIVDGVRCASRLGELLDQVSSGLQLDQTVVPTELRATVERITAMTFEPETSYAHAAIVVREFRGEWQTVYGAVTT